MHVQPYLYFNGRCEEALNFYKQALGAEVTFLMRYNESPAPRAPDMIPPGFETKVMHSSFRIGDTLLMASDGDSDEPPQFAGFSLVIKFKTAEQAERAFSALSEGGEIQVPLMLIFHSPKYGVVVDRYGVSWKLLVEQ